MQNKKQGFFLALPLLFYDLNIISIFAKHIFFHGNLLQGNKFRESPSLREARLCPAERTQFVEPLRLLALSCVTVRAAKSSGKNNKLSAHEFSFSARKRKL